MDEAFYGRVIQNLTDHLRGISLREEYVNSLLSVMEANLSYIPSSTSMREQADISLYDHVKLALAVAQEIPSAYTAKYLPILQIAAHRLLLDFVEVDKIQSREDFNCIPVRSGNYRKYFEYALNLQIKLSRKEYADFIRAITPLIVDLFEVVLKYQCRIDIDDYCRIDEKGVRKWSEKKLRGTEILSVLNESYPNGFSYSVISSHHLKILLDHYSDDPALKSLVDTLRGVESDIRNLAAHEIVSITDAKIKKLTGFDGAQIMDRIKKMFAYIGLKIDARWWHSYDDMNEEILERMSRN